MTKGRFNNENRFGKFYVGPESLETKEGLEDIKKVMGRCIITRAEFLDDRGKFEYIAWSEDFDDIEKGSMIPEYGWIFDSVEGTLQVIKIESLLDRSSE